MKTSTRTTLTNCLHRHASIRGLLAGMLCLGALGSAVAQKATSCGSDVTNLSVSIYKYTDATNTTTYNLQPDLTYADGTPAPYISGKTKGNNIDARFQVDNCTYDFTMNLYFSKRFMTYKFPGGSPLGTSANFTFFNMDRVADVPVTDGGSAFLNWCNTATDNYAGCGVDANGYFVRRSYGSGQLDQQNQYHLRFNYSPIDNVNPIATGTAYVKVYHTDANTWTMMPEQVPPPPSVTGTDGEWSVLLSNGTVAGYQKTPFKIVLKKL